MSGPLLLALRIALAAALYAFLGLALWLIWRDLRRESRRPAQPGVPVLVLVRRDLEADAGPALRFADPEVIVGRDPTCGLQLDDKTISARHSRLAFHHGQWWVEDLRSTNGTYLNLEAIGEPVVIAAGDCLRCGEVEFDVRIEPVEK